MDIIDRLVKHTQNVGSEYTSVVLRLGCTFESRRELWKNAGAWMTAPEILIWLVLRAAWASGFLITPPVIVRCSHSETHWLKLSEFALMGPAFHSLHASLVRQPPLVSLGSFHSLSIVIVQWQQALGCVVIFHCGVVPDHSNPPLCRWELKHQRQGVVCAGSYSRWASDGLRRKTRPPESQTGAYDLAVSAEERWWRAGQRRGCPSLDGRTLNGEAPRCEKPEQPVWGWAWARWPVTEATWIHEACLQSLVLFLWRDYSSPEKHCVLLRKAE